MKKVRDIMTREVKTVTRDTTLVELARLLMDHRINAAPVLDGARLVGIVSEADLIDREQRLHVPTLITVLDAVIPLDARRFQHELTRRSAAKVGDIMQAEVLTVTPDASIEDVATLMAERRIHTVPVVDGGAVVGIVGRSDLLRAIYVR